MKIIKYTYTLTYTFYTKPENICFANQQENVREEDKEAPRTLFILLNWTIIVGLVGRVWNDGMEKVNPEVYSRTTSTC
jgi:hypothetical protein